MTSRANARPGLWGILIALAAFACGTREPLPTIARIDRLELELPTGQTLTAADLDGRVHVVDFIFTSCEMACPMMTARMSELHKAYAGDDRVRLLSVSTDPETDTAEVLAAYAGKWNADPERWLFGRAPVEEVVRLSEKEFLLSAQGLPMGHSLKFALVDDQRHIRGYYDSEDAEDLRRLRVDLERLLG